MEDTIKNIVHVLEKDNSKEEDLRVSKKLLDSRIVMVSGEVNFKLAAKVTGELLFLNEQDSKKDVVMFINSPGGQVYSGFAIYDVMRWIQPTVKTVTMGMAASMGSIISLGASPGHRYSLPNSMFLIHQPLLSGTYFGSVSDVKIQAKEMIKLRDRIVQIYVEATGKEEEEIKLNLNRDFWLSSQEALEYGPKKLIDKIVVSPEELF